MIYFADKTYTPAKRTVCNSSIHGRESPTKLPIMKMCEILRQPLNQRDVFWDAAGGNGNGNSGGFRCSGSSTNSKSGSSSSSNTTSRSSSTSHHVVNTKKKKEYRLSKL